MKEESKIYLAFGLITLIAVLVGLVIYNQAGIKLKGSYTTTHIPLMGSVDNLVSAPNAYVVDTSTTTSATGVQARVYADGGYTIKQTVKTEGIENGLLCIQAVGGTATSTLSIRQLGLFDGLNGFDVGSSTESFVNSTTTLGIEPKSLSFDPGTATTTGKCYSINTMGYEITGFVIYGEDLDTDPNDGVQAWIEWVPIDIRQE